MSPTQESSSDHVTNKTRTESKLSAPVGSVVWWMPSCSDICSGCSSCYGCCHRCACCPSCCRCGPPCPWCFFWLPCCCCCCRPLPSDEQHEHIEYEDDKSTALAEGGALEAEPFEAEEYEADEAKLGESSEVEVGKTTERQDHAGLSGEKRAVSKTAAAKKRAKARVKRGPIASQPKIFTGSVGGTNPPPPEACIGPPPIPEHQPKTTLGEGVYLVYEYDKEGGSLSIKFSKEAIKGPGVLAYVKCNKEVAEFRFTRHDGSEKLCTNLQRDMQSEFIADRKKYYDGWATFVKQITAYNGSLVLLPAARLSPPPTVKIFKLLMKKVQEVAVDEPLTKADAEILAIVAGNTTKFDVESMAASEFVALAQNFGTAVSLMPDVKL